MSEPTTPAAHGISLSKLWLASGQTFPVNAALIATEISKQRFSDPIGKIADHGVPGVDGMLSKRSRGDWCISYDGSVELSGRINFTIAHEFGHYLLHRQTRDTFQCGQGSMLDYGSKEAKVIEVEANKFASFLLMPIDDFKNQISGQSVTVSLIGHCAERYGTTFTATALKWLEFTEETAILVVARDDFVCWSYPSAMARRQHIYLPAGTPVPQHSLDWLAESGVQNTRNTSRRVPAGVWHPSFDAEECVIVSDHYELTIFLVRFPLSATVDHEEEQENDMYSFYSDKAQGNNW